MKNPKTSKLFEKRIDPNSGVEYYVLTAKRTVYQQSFYFVNDPMTKDGRYLWFYASPNPVYDTCSRNLGYVDFLLDEIVICYDVLFDDGSPYIDTDTGDAYFTHRKSIYKREPGKNKLAVKLCTVNIPGYVAKLSTHLTRLSDKNRFFLDIGRSDLGFCQGVVDIRDGSFEPWTQSVHNTNHGQINPKNDRIALCAYDRFTKLDGTSVRIPKNANGVYERLWTVTADGKRTMYPPRDNYATHEWWSADGKKIYYVNDLGIQRLNLVSGEHVCVHECYPWHAHATADESLYVFDEKVLDGYPRWFRGCPAAVKVYNAKSNKELTVVTKMPANGFSPENQCAYHIDPHPRFSGGEKYITFSTSELGGCDLAVVSVEQILNLTK